MSLIVQKFGGSSVADTKRVQNVARIVTEEYKKGNEVVVVVSAQGDTTDDLIAKAHELNAGTPSKREMDMLMSAGEQISIALLAIAIEKMGFPVVSLLGWQAGFQTDSNYSAARIKKIEAERLRAELAKKNIVVVAGFQGLNKYDDITTLGRGGSDTSAVAIAAALRADLCQIYTDVDGVYTADPRKVRNTRKLEEITFDEMLELASLGAQVLNNRSVELAKKYKESSKVVHAILAHHGDIEPKTIEACLVQAADGISAARPGARRENLESYIKRLEQLEEIANSFKGVENSYAIQAGREVRIMVKSDVVSDDETVLMAKDIVKQIEGTMEYPGQIKVNVIRELRAIEFAK